MSRTRIVVLESDWSRDGEEVSLSPGEKVGPEHVYDRVFGDAARLIDAKVEADCAQFVAEEGFRTLLKRYLSLDRSPHLVVGGHGTRGGRLSTASGAFPVFECLREEWSSAQDRGRVGKPHPKRDRGLLFASCGLLSLKSEPERLLRDGPFQWVAGYRRDVSFVTSLITELHFWDVYVNGLSLEANEDNPSRRTKTKTICGKRRALPAALSTYLQVSGSFGARFDVRILWHENYVSSLEVFHELALRHDLVDERIERIARSPAARRWLDHHKKVEQRMAKLFRRQWEWNPET